jgi:hypothetical protein
VQFALTLILNHLDESVSSPEKASIGGSISAIAGYFFNELQVFHAASVPFGVNSMQCLADFASNRNESVWWTVTPQTRCHALRLKSGRQAGRKSHSAEIGRPHRPISEL